MSCFLLFPHRPSEPERALGSAATAQSCHADQRLPQYVNYNKTFCTQQLLWHGTIQHPRHRGRRVNHAALRSSLTWGRACHCARTDLCGRKEGAVRRPVHACDPTSVTL
eukprot:361114-Chlamydomonas_euryale.AAC.5